MISLYFLILGKLESLILEVVGVRMIEIALTNEEEKEKKKSALMSTIHSSQMHQCSKLRLRHRPS